MLILSICDVDNIIKYSFPGIKKLLVPFSLGDNWPIVHEGGGGRTRKQDSGGCRNYEDSPLGYDFGGTTLYSSIADI